MAGEYLELKDYVEMGVVLSSTIYVFYKLYKKTKEISRFGEPVSGDGKSMRRYINMQYLVFHIDFPRMF